MSMKEMSPQEFDRVLASIGSRHDGRPTLSNGSLGAPFDRRDFLKGMGLMMVGVTVAGTAEALTKSNAAYGDCPLDAEAAPLARVLADPDKNIVDSWIAIGQDNSVTWFTSRVQFGPGTCTGQMQVLADSLDVAFNRIKLVSGDTYLVPETGVNAGSQSISAHGTAIRRVAGEARWALLQMASTRLGVAVDQLVVSDAVISVKNDPSKKVSYGELIGGKRFNITLRRISDSPYYGPQFEGTAPLKPLTEFKISGTSVPRFDVPGKALGERVFIQDLIIPGMLHARAVRPKGQSRLGSDCKLISVDKSSVAGMPGLVDVVVRTDAPLRAGLSIPGTWPYTLVAVVCEREEQAIAAAEKLKVTWADPPAMPNGADVYADLRARGAQPGNVTQAGDFDAALASAAKTYSATYKYPYQAHASIGASCGLADVRGDKAIVWTDDYIVHPARNRLAYMLRLPNDNVQVKWVEGSGAYGSNCGQQAAIDAALISQALGRPIRVQYMRYDEIGREDYGGASSYDMKAGLDASNRIVAYEWQGYPSGATRSARDYDFAKGPANFRIQTHGASQVVTTGYLRAPGSQSAAFPTESFLDELAALAKEDALQFRLKHLSLQEVIDVMKGAAQGAGWQSRPSPNPANANNRTGVVKGRGIAYGYWDSPCAVVAEVEVDQTTGVVRVTRLVTAIDIGWVVNPDAALNQMEGGAIFGTSFALLEEVKFQNNRVSAEDWVSYPILKFSEVPKVEVVFVNNRPEAGWKGGCGETSSTATPTAIANAIFDATGARVRQIPLTPERVLAALKQR